MKKNKETKTDKGFSLWSDRRFKGWMTAFVILLILVLAGVATYPLIPAPVVQGYLLKGGTREMSVNAPFRITFSQLMNNSSVEKNFKITPALEGSFSWEGNTLNFAPTDQIKIGETYQITIGTGAKGIFQKSLESEYSEFYQIVAAPKVVLMTPNAGSSDVPADAKINIMFDRPLGGLTTLSAGRDKFPEIRLEPAVNGRFKWLGTSALQFIPDRLNKATSYTLTVPKGTAVTDGGYTEEEFSQSFETERPLVLSMLSTDAQNDSDFSPKSALKVTFNQAVDLGSAGEMIKLQRIEKDKTVEESMRVRYFNQNDWKAEQDRSNQLMEMNQLDDVKVETDTKAVDLPKPEIPDQAELAQSLIIESSTGLQPESKYVLLIKSGLKGMKGPLTTVEDRSFSFNVAGALKILSSDYLPEGQDNRLANPIFKFSNPLNLHSFQNKVNVSPTNKNDDGTVIVPDANTYESSNSLRIGYDFKPATDYVVTIAEGIQDIFGNIAAEPVVIKFRTGNYKPSFNLEKGTDISIVDGSKAAAFYLKSVNIDKAEIKLKKLSNDDFANMYADGYINYNDLSIPRGESEWVGEMPVKLELNQRGHTLMDLDQLNGSKLLPGFYYLEVSAPNVTTTRCLYDWQTDHPGCQEAPKVEKTLLVISRSALAVKYSAEQMMIWATDLQNGEPINNMDITVFDSAKKHTLKAVTNINGIAKIDLPKNPDGNYLDYLVFGAKDNDQTFTHTTWSDGVAPWNFNIDYQNVTPQYYMYLYTDRPIYRPGQAVFFKGILRQEKDYKFQLPESKKMAVTVFDSEGNQIYQQELGLSANGTIEGNLQLGQNISSGDYQIVAKLIDQKGPEWLNNFDASFKVYEYRKPDYKLDLTPDKKDYINGQTASVKVEAGYFFGAPLADAEVKWTLKGQDYYYILPEELANKLAGSWFSFAEEGYFCYWGCQSGSEVISQGTGKTDAKGVATISLPFNLNDKKISQIYTLEATVTDANNQSVSNRVDMAVHKGEFYLGVRSQDYLVSKDQPAKIQVLAVSTEGKTMPGKTLQVSSYERTWNTVKRKSVDGDYYFENNYDDKLLETKNVTTDGDGLGSVEFNLKQGGDFKIEATAKDSRGNQVKSSTSVYVSSGEFVNWGSENNDQIELVTDKMEYKVGDTAKILIKSPYRNVYALVTYEKDQVLDQKVIKLDSNSQTIEVPITERFQPNAFVSVVIVKGNAYDAGLGVPADGGVDERQVASFKVGYASLQVNTENKRLNIAVNSDKARYAPGETVKLQVKSTDFSGKAVAADLSIAVVDESVLSLTNSVTADLLNVFYRKRMLGVSFAETLTKALSRINVQVEAGMKGGGGGALAKRGEFKDTAFYQADLFTDESGNGSVEFKLPDNLTSWQVMAVGISDDTKSTQALVGSGKYSFVVNKDILIRPVLPRFMTSGDEMQISAIVHNYTADTQNVKVTLQADGLELKSPADQNIVVKSGTDQKVNWEIRVGNTENAKIEFIAVANGGERGDSVEFNLPVHQSSFPETVAVGKVLDGEEKQLEKVWLPSGLDLSKGRLQISIAATLAGTLNEGLKYLISYPYGCTEQIASSILPNLALKQLIDTGKFQTKDLPAATMDKNVNAGLQQLYKNQQPNGGFGLWLNSQSNAYLTAYMVDTLYQAKLAGYAVDKAVMDKALGYLHNYVYGKANVSEDPKFTANNKAFVLYVMSEVGQGDLALNNNLYDQKDLLRVVSKAYLAMSLQTLNAQKPDQGITGKITELKKDLENAAEQTPRGATITEKDLDYSLFDTNTRTTAVVLRTLNRIQPDNPLIPKIVSGLLMGKKGGHFETTQETAVSLLALIEYLKTSNELSPAFEAQIGLNGEQILDANFTSSNVFEVKKQQIVLKDLLPNNLDNELSFQKIGTGKMYADLDLQYYLPIDQQKAENEGIDVVQEYYSIDDTRMEHPLHSVKVGQNLHGHLTIITPEDRHYLMVEDFLPAGLEGIDFNLNTAEQGLQKEEKGCYYADCSSWYFQHSEIKDDRLMYFADFLPKGVYELDYYVRATSVGKFADLPTLAQETYYPEVFGRTAGKLLEITE